MTASTARLSLRDTGKRLGAVDGAWWPREYTDAELLAVAAAVEPSFQKVVRAALSMAGWADIPRRIGTGRDTLRIDLFRTGEPHVVRLVGEDGRTLDLLLIAPDTAADDAEAALASGADADDMRTVGELLTPGVRTG